MTSGRSFVACRLRHGSVDLRLPQKVKDLILVKDSHDLRLVVPRLVGLRHLVGWIEQVPDRVDVDLLEADLDGLLLWVDLVEYLLQSSRDDALGLL